MDAKLTGELCVSGGSSAVRLLKGGKILFPENIE